MTNFYINPLSACEQCHTNDEVYGIVSELVDVFKYIEPVLRARIFHLVYDPRIEARCVIQETNFNSSINSIRGTNHSDVLRLWFIFTKNRAVKAQLDQVQVNISSDSLSNTEIGGELSLDYQEADCFLSLGNFALLQEPRLKIQNGNTHVVGNAYSQDSIKSLLPQYEGNPKHRNQGYNDRSGNYVSPMPLSDDQAQSLLLLSVEIGSDRWYACIKTHSYFCFKLTHPDRQIYHGYQLQVDETPIIVKQQLPI